MFQSQKLFTKMIWLRYEMKRFMNLIGIKSRNAFEEKNNTAIKNKVLNLYSQLLKKEKKTILRENLKDVVFAKNKGLKDNARWHEGCSEKRRETAKRDRKRQTP